MQKKEIKISDAEWLVMKILWKEQPLTSENIIQRLASKVSWHPKTVRTLISRLVQKKAIAFKAEGREYLYYPLLEENKSIKEETSSFVKRVFDGALQPMLAHFVENQTLSSKEIKELKNLLHKKMKGKKS